MRFNDYYILEEVKFPDLIYSGQRQVKPTFNKKELGKGNDQEGVGFYFTTDKDEAWGYTESKGIIIEAKFNGNLIDKNTVLDYDKAVRLIEMSPVLEDVLQDFGMDPPYVSRAQAMKDLKFSMINKNDTKDTFLQIWYDFYRRGNNDWMFVENMVKLGYDGLLVDKANGVKHIIVYDPDALDIINVENINAI